MLTKEEIQVLIVKRIMAAIDGCNSYHSNHIEGQIRGLLAVLLDGENVKLTGDATQVLDIAGIPWKPFNEKGEGWNVDDDWLRERGCIVDGDKIFHLKLKGW